MRFQEFANPGLVSGLQHGPKQADTDSLDPFLHEMLDCGDNGLLVQRLHDLTGGIDSLRNLEGQAARYIGVRKGDGIIEWLYPPAFPE